MNSVYIIIDMSMDSVEEYLYIILLLMHIGWMMSS